MGIMIDYFEPAIYTVTFDVNSGTLDANLCEASYGEGEALKNLPSPQKDGYTFTGWYSDSVDGSIMTDGVPVMSDMTLYAHWRENATQLDIEDGVLIHVELNGEKVYLPSPNLHALFLIRHMVSHFAAAEITLRQVLEWAFFVEKHTKEVDWDWLLPLLEQYHMKEFFNSINAICVEDLGFSACIFPYVQYLPDLKQIVLSDILEPEYTAEEPCELIKRLVYKYRRWQGNAWKQEMCYGESRWSAFWMGIWAKMLKPSSI